MKMMGQNNPMEVKPILEINPKSTIVKSLGTIEDQARIDDISRLLLDQAMLLEGVELKSLPDFVKRMNRVIEKTV
jgi:molecular chaperone HtpG